MCIIIDNCERHKFLNPGRHPEAGPVIDWIDNRNGAFAVGGSKYLAEWCPTPRLLFLMKEYFTSGRARVFPKDAVDSEQRSLDSKGACKSNDSHIIALARVSGARVLWSSDQRSGLHEDFRDPSLVNQPRGSVYQSADHRHLLSHSQSCGSCTKQMGTAQDLFA